jgi:Probable cobalt transporter subunit (CbtA)
MVRSLLIRGMIAGLIAGILAFGFARVFGEPQVDRAIAFEEQMDKAKEEKAAQQMLSSATGSSASSGSMSTANDGSMAGMNMSHADAEPELVSRAVQSGIGLFTGVVVYGTAFGGLFALVFAYAYGRMSNLSPRATAALLAGAAFLALVIVPDIKYPANPPAVGNPDTIGERTGFFLVMILATIAAMIIAGKIARHMAEQLGGWNAALLGGAIFIALVVIVQLLLPTINEVPEGFPATVLWRFRITSIGIEAILWTTIGLVFGALAQKVLVRGRWSPAYA